MDYRHFLSLFCLAMVAVLSPLSPPHHHSGMSVSGATVPSLSANQKESLTRLILGILEHYQNVEKKGHGVRVAFYEEDGQWKAFPTNFDTVNELSQAVRSFPEAVAWTICFDGRPLGSLASKSPQSYNLYADVGVQQITSKGNIPTVGQPTTLFSGWPEGRTYRPLVLDSRPQCADPGKWRPEKPEAGEINAIKDYLQKTFHLSANKVSKATIRVNKSYGSPVRGAKLISLDISSVQVIPVDGEDDQNKGAWFYLKQGDVRHLGSNMLLVDIGDYDQDGDEEAVFKIQRYDNDGYALYYEGFKHSVEFSWHYH